MYFNSTMVRLIANNAIQNAFTIELFQFHDGTIDRSFTTITLVSVVTFQFHDGTIDSQFQRFICHFFTHFNSTMVRLIVAANSDFPLPQKFQFHDGTIDRKSTVKIEKVNYLFQFHDGTIDSFIPVITAKKRCLFQFHDGTIDSFFQQCFCCLLNLFQFHDGTIDRGIPAFLPNWEQISIPRWYD